MEYKDTEMWNEICAIGLTMILKVMKQEQGTFNMWFILCCLSLANLIFIQNEPRNNLKI